MLRCGFETALQNHTARCGIQHGFLERPARAQTPQEKAKFEVPFHGYAALMDAESGAAVLADAKYGLRLEGGLMEIALLRSPTYPDHTADHGRHRISYAFLPFAGAVCFGEAQEQSDRLAYRPLVFPGRKLSHLAPLFQIEADGVRVEAVKRAETGKQIVVRLANVGGVNTQCILSAAGGSVHRSGLDESVGMELKTGGLLQMRPFELVTCALNPVPANAKDIASPPQASACESLAER